MAWHHSSWPDRALAALLSPTWGRSASIAREAPVSLTHVYGVECNVVTAFRSRSVSNSRHVDRTAALGRAAGLDARRRCDARSAYCVRAGCTGDMGHFSENQVRLPRKRILGL
jgi:hypothetical protein